MPPMNMPPMQPPMNMPPMNMPPMMPEVRYNEPGYPAVTENQWLQQQHYDYAIQHDHHIAMQYQQHILVQQQQMQHMQIQLQQMQLQIQAQKLNEQPSTEVAHERSGTQVPHLPAPTPTPAIAPEPVVAPAPAPAADAEPIIVRAPVNSAPITFGTVSELALQAPTQGQLPEPKRKSARPRDRESGQKVTTNNPKSLSALVDKDSLNVASTEHIPKVKSNVLSKEVEIQEEKEKKLNTISAKKSSKSKKEPLATDAAKQTDGTLLTPPAEQATIKVNAGTALLSLLKAVPKASKKAIPI